MKKAIVPATDGTGKPRRWAIQMPSGSIDAAIKDATSVFPGVLGMIIDEIRITIAIQERCPRSCSVGTRTTELRSAMAIAFTSMYQRLKSPFRCGVQWQERMYANRPAEIRMPLASTASTLAE